MSAAIVALRKAASVAADAHQISVRELMQPSGSKARTARHVAFYLASVAGNQPVRRLSRAARLQRSHLQYALRRIEDLRDDPSFDLFVGALEVRVRATLAPLEDAA